MPVLHAIRITNEPPFPPCSTDTATTSSELALSPQRNARVSARLSSCFKVSFPSTDGPLRVGKRCSSSFPGSSVSIESRTIFSLANGGSISNTLLRIHSPTTNIEKARQKKIKVLVLKFAVASQPGCFRMPDAGNHFSHIQYLQSFPGYCDRKI